MVRSIILALILLSLNFLPASAQSTKSVKFHLWLDGNANTLFDYFGYDWCLGGDTLTVWKLGGGLQPWFYLPINHSDVLITGGNSGILECRSNSSAIYNIPPGNYKITGGVPSHTTYFTVQSYGAGTQLIGHKMTSWSGE